MKVAFLTTRLNKPSARFRFFQYEPYLKRAGIECETFLLPEGFFKRIALFKKFSSFDAVFLQKRLLGALEWRSLRKHSRKIIYDFDDAIMYDDSKKDAALSKRRLSCFKKTVESSDVVIAGNNYLVDWAKKYRKDVLLIPTPVDTDLYEKAAMMKDEKHFTLGWIGSRGTIQYLKNIEGALAVVAEKIPGVRLKIVSDEFPSIKDITVIEKKWSASDEVSDIKSFDIGLMPLVDDPWTRGKCAFKLLQYMAAGVPAIASPVGVNKDIVSDGKSGFLADTQNEWAAAVTSLAGDEALRKKFSTEGQRVVKEGYSLSSCSLLLIDALRKAAQKT